ncbi:strigolactones hydrolase CXE15-like [Coffea arabica]|uniref:Strigolactones hydrolase CXE15-like n=1 Tax=Coffea arabica TaxID=13443 RepID=A0ABM4UX20_COFAR
MDSSSSSSTAQQAIEDCFGVLKLYSDGSISRTSHKEHQVKTHDDGSAIWKDCCFDSNNNLQQRVYKPKNHYYSSSNKNEYRKNLPVVYYLHAGGFCFTSRNAHNTCLSLCSGLQALIICPYYRLAPEDRLPAALEDAVTGLKFLQAQALRESREVDHEKWLFDIGGVDVDRVFIFGDSSGGNIAHHLAIQLGSGSLELSPIRVRGYILLSPFFGGVFRTKSEEESPKEDFLEPGDLWFWRLAMPNGADRDHPLVNPFGPKSPSLEGLSLDPFLVLVGGDEILKDRVEDYAKRMKSLNNNVKYVEFKGKQHGFFTSYPYFGESQNVVQIVKNFMSESSN